MTSLKHRKRAYYLAGVFLVVGAICYAAFPVKAPEQPIRVMFKAVSGNVLFDHKAHLSETGYGIACKECHHHPQEDEADLRACKACHHVPPEGEKVPSACLDCHDATEVEDTEIIKSSDAFHRQCAGCHLDFGAGPKEQECSSCHVL